jgi:hypothetical protein
MNQDDRRGSRRWGTLTILSAAAGAALAAAMIPAAPAFAITGGGGGELGTVDTDLTNDGATPAVVTDVNDFLGGLSPAVETRDETILIDILNVDPGFAHFLDFLADFGGGGDIAAGAF